MEKGDQEHRGSVPQTQKQIEIDARKATREAKTWGSEIVKEEKKRRKEISDWKVEAQKWNKESQRLRRNEKAQERRAEQNRRIKEAKRKGKKSSVSFS